MAIDGEFGTSMTIPGKLLCVDEEGKPTSCTNSTEKKAWKGEWWSLNYLSRTVVPTIDVFINGGAEEPVAHPAVHFTAYFKLIPGEAADWVWDAETFQLSFILRLGLDSPASPEVNLILLDYDVPSPNGFDVEGFIFGPGHMFLDALHGGDVRLYLWDFLSAGTHDGCNHFLGSPPDTNPMRSTWYSTSVTSGFGMPFYNVVQNTILQAPLGQIPMDLLEFHVMKKFSIQLEGLVNPYVANPDVTVAVEGTSSEGSMWTTWTVTVEAMHLDVISAIVNPILCRSSETIGDGALRGAVGGAAVGWGPELYESADGGADAGVIPKVKVDPGDIRVLTIFCVKDGESEFPWGFGMPSVIRVFLAPEEAVVTSARAQAPKPHGFIPFPLPEMILNGIDEFRPLKEMTYEDGLFPKTGPCSVLLSKKEGFTELNVKIGTKKKSSKEELFVFPLCKIRLASKWEYTESPGQTLEELWDDYPLADQLTVQYSTNQVCLPVPGRYVTVRAVGYQFPNFKPVCLFCFADTPAGVLSGEESPTVFAPIESTVPSGMGIYSNGSILPHFEISNVIMHLVGGYDVCPLWNEHPDGTASTNVEQKEVTKGTTLKVIAEFTEAHGDRAPIIVAGTFTLQAQVEVISVDDECEDLLQEPAKKPVVFKPHPMDWLRPNMKYFYEGCPTPKPGEDPWHPGPLLTPHMLGLLTPSGWRAFLALPNPRKKKGHNR